VRLLLDAWRLAVGTLTAVPVRPPALVDRRRAGLAMMLAPLAVVPLGAAVALIVAAGTRRDLAPLAIAVVAIAAVVVGNRAFHIDGLADTVDGFAASYDRERALAVMKTGASGPAGVAAIVLVLGAQIAGLAGLLTGPDPVARAVLAGLLVCVSRAALVLCCARGVPSARPGGLGDTYTQTVPVLVAAAIWGAFAVALAWLVPLVEIDWWRGPLAVVLAAVVVLVLLGRATRRLGGVTGDVFGAAVELALATLLVVLS
jgi:adenosylcobinamide-GDP ribazoletransferase